MVTHCDRHGIKSDVRGRRVVGVINWRKNISDLPVPPPLILLIFVGALQSD